MTTPHKWADVIKAWADGKPIQWKSRYTEIWESFDDKVQKVTPPFGASDIEWRIKPETVKYRRYLWQTSTGPRVGICMDATAVAALSAACAFIRWIDTEWQEEEV